MKSIILLALFFFIYTISSYIHLGPDHKHFWADNVPLLLGTLPSTIPHCFLPLLHGWPHKFFKLVRHNCKELLLGQMMYHE